MEARRTNRNENVKYLLLEVFRSNLGYIDMCDMNFYIKDKNIFCCILDLKME